MIRAILIAVVLIGSPRDIANHPVKHGKAIELPPLPKTLPFKVSKVLVVPPPRSYWLVFSNPNPASETWVIETRQRVKDPWAFFAQGSVNSFQEASNQFWPTQSMAFYRVGFQ